MSSEADRWNDACVIAYDNPKQAFGTGEMYGLLSAVEMLEALPATMKLLPGFGLALATINAAAMTKRSNVAITTLRFAAKQGVDIATHTCASFPEGVRVLPMDLAEMAEA